MGAVLATVGWPLPMRCQKHTPSVLDCDNPDLSRHCEMSLGAKLPLVENHCSRHVTCWRLGVVYAKSMNWGITLLSSFLHLLYLLSLFCGPGTVLGDRDIKMNKTWFLPQGEELVRENSSVNILPIGVVNAVK